MTGLFQAFSAAWISRISDMKIQQVAVNYLHEHDRILVQVNNARQEEIRFWLTRRLCRDWVPVLNASVLDLLQHPLSTPPRAADAHAARGADFQQPFRQAVQHWPLGTRPLLVGSVAMRPSDCGGVRFAFAETADRLAEQRQFQALMAGPLVQAFAHLLDHAMDSAEWHPPAWAARAAPSALPAARADSSGYLH